MARPGTSFYSINIIFACRRIILAGDITPHNGNVFASVAGYGLDWFSVTLSEGYLCEKFLRKEWQWEIAKERLKQELDHPNESWIESEHREQIAQLIGRETSLGPFVWDWDTPNVTDFYSTLYDLSQSYVDDGPPGYAYPKIDAGWLCAIQQRFVELWEK